MFRSKRRGGFFRSPFSFLPTVSGIEKFFYSLRKVKKFFPRCLFLHKHFVRGRSARRQKNERREKKETEIVIPIHTHDEGEMACHREAEKSEKERTNTPIPSSVAIEGVKENDTGKMHEIERYMEIRYPYDDVFAMVDVVAPAIYREFAQIRRVLVDDRKPSETRFSRRTSYRTRSEFKEALVRRRPLRVEIGAAWTIQPRLWKAYGSGSARIATREIAFDVDIDEYDAGNKRGLPRARACCTGSACCVACWPIVTIGCSMIDAALDEYGARGVGWFFSGRRGMHCWIIDPSISTADASEREAFKWIVAQDVPSFVLAGAALRDPLCERVLSIVVDVGRGGVRRSEDMFLGWYARRHPMCAFSAVVRALSNKHEIKESVAPLVDAVSAAEKAAEEVVEPTLAELRKKDPWKDAFVSSEAENGIRCEQIEVALKMLSAAVSREPDPWGGGSFETTASAISEAALSCLLPRTDSPVTIQPNHLLKSPMCVHPDTLRLCVRVPRERLRTFLPIDAPSLLGSGDPTLPPAFDDEAKATEAFSEFKKWTRGLSNNSQNPSIVAK